jgi:hypothetical protein
MLKKQSPWKNDESLELFAFVALGGTNDLSVKSPKDIAANMKIVCEKAKAHKFKHVFISTIPMFPNLDKFAVLKVAIFCCCSHCFSKNIFVEQTFANKSVDFKFGISFDSVSRCCSYHRRVIVG